MNLSLYRLRKQLKRDKSGQGSLVAVALGGIVLSTLVASATSWYLTMRHNLGDTEDKLEAQTIAQSEWERLSHMSLDELEANRNTFKTPYSAGTGSQFSISVNLGEKGTFNGGTCGAVSGGYANCFKNTTITVYRDGNRLFTTRTLPLMAGDYTRKEIDAKLSAEAKARSDKDTDLQSQINNLTTRLNGKEFIKNKTPNYDLNLRYEKKAGEDSFNLHAYNGNTEIQLGGNGDTHYVVESYYGANNWYRVYSDGWIEQGGVVNYPWSGQGNDVTFAKPFKTKIVTFLYGSNIQWPSAHIPRAYASNLTGFKMGMDAWDAIGRYASGIVYHYYATGF